MTRSSATPPREEPRREQGDASDYLNLVETMIVALDAEGRITAINRKGCQLLGWAEEELVGQFWFSFCLPQPDGMDELLPIFRTLMAGEMEGAEYFENAILTRSGESRLIAWHNALLRDSQGAVVGTLSSGNDITARRQAETALHGSRQLIEGILDAIPARVFWKDRDLVYLGCNAAFARDAGFDDPKDIIGKSDYQMVWRDQAESYRAADRRVIHNGRAEILIEESQTTPEGDTIALLTSKVPLCDPDGEIYGVLGTYSDITELKRTEDQLRESEARFRSLIEHASDGITILDREGNNRYLSPAAEKLTGYSLEELAGRSAFNLVHPDDRARAEAQWDQVLEDPDRVVVEEIRFRTKGGGWRTFECTDSNLLDTPAVEGIVINTRDVTERKGLEAQLRHSQRMEAMGRLAGGIAHDFNNLLTVIRGQSDLLLADLDESHASRQDIEVIRHAADRAARLTGQLLALGREQVLRPRIVDLNSIVLGMEELLVRVLGEDVRLEINLAAEVPTIEIDPGQLEQVIMNLVVNARAAMPEGGSLQLSTREEELGREEALLHPDLEPGRVVSLVVTDTGTGMDDETLQRLFEPFFTTKQGEGGTGLGLSVTYGIIEQSHGTIHVDSDPGKGTTFVLRFRPAGGAPELVPTRPPDVAELQEFSGTVLLVEDDASVQRISRRILERAGLQVRTVGVAEDALEVLEEDGGSIDLILTDLVLPGIGGRVLVEKVRERFPQISLLVMSGHARGSLGGQTALPQDVGFIEKPFSMEELILAVRSALHG